MSLIRNIFVGAVTSICVFMLTGIFLGSLDVALEKSQAPLMIIAMPIILLCGLLVTCTLFVVDAIKQSKSQN